MCMLLFLCMFYFFVYVYFIKYREKNWPAFDTSLQSSANIFEFFEIVNSYNEHDISLIREDIRSTFNKYTNKCESIFRRNNFELLVRKILDTDNDDINDIRNESDMSVDPYDDEYEESESDESSDEDDDDDEEFVDKFNSEENIYPSAVSRLTSLAHAPKDGMQGALAFHSRKDTDTTGTLMLAAEYGISEQEVQMSMAEQSQRYIHSERDLARTTDGEEEDDDESYDDDDQNESSSMPARPSMAALQATLNESSDDDTGFDTAVEHTDVDTDGGLLLGPSSKSLNISFGESEEVDDRDLIFDEEVDDVDQQENKGKHK